MHNKLAVPQPDQLWVNHSYIEEVSHRSRYLKKQRKIQNRWTTKCNVFIKVNGTPEEARVLLIRKWRSWINTNEILETE